MKTTDTSILKQFYSVLNRKLLTEEVYNMLLKRWYLDKIDLEEEQLKINQKQSNLSRSQRAAVPEFILLRKILDEKKQAEENSISMNMTPQETNIMNDQISF